MAETIIFLTKSDFTNLADFIIRTFKATFIPDVNFEKPESIELRTVEEILTHIQNYPHQKATALSYLIVSPSWSVEPIYFDFVDNPLLGKYYYALKRYGGPSIELIPSMHDLHRSQTEKVISGMIADYSYYISGSFLKDKENGYKTIERPQTLKQSLNEIRKFIKRNGQKVVYRNGITRVGYAMTDACKLYEKGVKLMQGDLTFERE